MSLSTVGVDDAGGPPVPIPNTEVKPCSAEDSALATGCENRKMPTFDSEYFFFCFTGNCSFPDTRVKKKDLYARSY